MPYLRPCFVRKASKQFSKHTLWLGCIPLSLKPLDSLVYLQLLRLPCVIMTCLSAVAGFPRLCLTPFLHHRRFHGDCNPLAQGRSRGGDHSWGTQWVLWVAGRHNARFLCIIIATIYLVLAIALLLKFLQYLYSPTSSDILLGPPSISLLPPLFSPLFGFMSCLEQKL